MDHGLSNSLVEATRKIHEKKTKEQEKLQAFMRKELKKLGVNSPSELTIDQRKELFNKVDAAFVSDGEADGTDLEPEDKVNEAKSISLGDSIKLINNFLEKGKIVRNEVKDFRKIQSDFSKGKILDPKQKKMVAGLMKQIGAGILEGLTAETSPKSVESFGYDEIELKEAVVLTVKDFVKQFRKGGNFFLKPVQFKTKKGEFIHTRGGAGNRIKNNKAVSPTILFVDRMGASTGVLGKETDVVDIINTKFESRNLKEASDPTTGLDAAEERFFRVEVLNGTTGKMAVFMTTGTSHKEAEQQALFAARDEKDLRNPPNVGGFQLVANSSTEISQDEFDAGQVKEPVGPKTGRNIANESVIIEGIDPILKQVGDIIKGKTLVTVDRKELEKLFGKRDVDFVTSPLAAWMIKYKSKLLVITSKKNVTPGKDDLIVGDLVAGFM